MRRFVLVLLLCLPCLTWASTPTEDMQRMFGASDRYVAFFHHFKAAVQKGDRETVASLARYPMKLRLGDAQVLLRTRKDLLARYDEVLTPKVVAVITAQRFDDLFVNVQGVMFGRGEVWYGGICKDKDCNTVDVRVIRFNP